MYRAFSPHKPRTTLHNRPFSRGDGGRGGRSWRMPPPPSSTIASCPSDNLFQKNRPPVQARPGRHKRAPLDPGPAGRVLEARNGRINRRNFQINTLFYNTTTDFSKNCKCIRNLKTHKKMYRQDPGDTSAPRSILALPAATSKRVGVPLSPSEAYIYGCVGFGL